MSEYDGITEATSPWSGVTAQANFLSLVNHVLTQGAKATRPSELGAGGVWAKDIGGGDFELYLYDGTTDHLIPAGVGTNGRLIGVQIFSTAGSDTYTPTTGAARAIVEVIGAGGGGGGADGDTTATEGGVGAGGGAGGYVWAYITLDAATYAVVIGAGGAGGSTAGSAGGDTTLTSNGDSGAGLSIDAGGGSGGGARIDDNTSGQVGGNGGDVATLIGTSLIESMQLEGHSGGTGFVITSENIVGAGLAIGGFGGPSKYGESEDGAKSDVTNTSYAGGTCHGNGGGGSGAAALGATTAQAGGDGGDGIIIIWEYSE